MANTSTSVSIFENISFKPTNSQAKALYELEEFIENASEDRVFILSGSAGTGKTTLTKAVVDYLNHLDLPVILLAPTGKAASILKSKSGLETQTIHQLVYHPEQLEDGRVKFNFKGNSSEVRTIYIVDEASMIPAKNASSGEYISTNPLLFDLMRFVFSGSPLNQIVFLGDAYQLTPVLEDESIALSAKRINEIFELTVKQVQLTEITRQAGDSPVLTLANQIKTARDNNISLYSLRPPRLASEALALDYYTTFFDCQHLDEIMMICKSNDQVQQWNRRIREKLGFGHFTLCVGDVVMLRSAWMDTTYQMVNGNMGVIASLSDNTEEIAGLKFKDAEIIFKNGEENIRINTKVFIDSLDNPTAKVDTESIKYLKNDRMIKNTVFRASQRAKDDLYMNAMKLSYGYALTGHKAQGSEWKRVLITPDKLHSNDHAWMYTAVTRAKNELFSWWFNK
ncbi:DUF2075 domain-containing protein [Lacihabitans sp. CCS-44]|uniref:ATP-dependent DNA helicase n=1 Tax=Lacihabitans sp. CCS-44 TaxID=2487331 RepID=UPI0020CDBE70|nr:AAA family ATPase [Lacihabitans sp. CCS-44]MCP9755178.1 DUF2075 domain-containing protein [Lacihabitans sp. CCS-44]